MFDFDSSMEALRLWSFWSD